MVLHVAGAHANAFANGALAFLLQQAKNFEPGRIRHGLKRRDKLFIRQGHILIIVDINGRWVKLVSF
jgi:hypothetical protein